MLVTSAVRRHKKSPPTCEKAAAVGVAPLPVGGNEDLSVSRLAAVLRGSFSKGLDEAQWQGDETLGPMHVHFLKTYWQNDVMPLPLTRKSMAAGLSSLSEWANQQHNW